MRFKIDPEFRDRQRPHTPQEREAHRLLIETNGVKPGSIVVADILGELILMDGHHTVEVCEELNLKLPPWVTYKFPSRELALEWIDQHAQARRNLSPEELAAVRERRRAKVVEARSEGQSTRQISETIGVSERTVRRDLDASGASGDAPDQEKPQAQNGSCDTNTGHLHPGEGRNQGITVGRDGKTYASEQSVFCERCQRVGPVQDCQKCERARRKKRKKKPKQGRESYRFDRKTLMEKLGPALREVDTLGSQFDPKQNNSPKSKNLRDLLTAFVDGMQAWAKELK